MIVPYGVDVPMRRFPVANFLLAAITTSVGLGILFGHPHALLPYIVLWRGGQFRFTQLAGYLLVHGNLVHLLINVVVLFRFGNAVNAKLGDIPYLLFYLAGGIVAGLAWLWLGYGPCLLGASGAIWAVIGAFMVFHPRNDVNEPGGFFVGRIIFRVPSLLLILFFLAFDMWGLTRPHTSRVAYICHVAGAVFGAATAAVLLKTRIVESPRGEENLLQFLDLD
jgi:membrane associated rhomboid family serine protease